jgi:membrane protease YdiL (CAAX protease family)
VLVALAYVAMRFIVSAMFPIGSIETIPGVGVLYQPGPYKWWVRDTIMDAPRLLTFGVTLWVGWRFWGLERFGWHARRPVLGLVGGSVVGGLVLLDAVFRAQPFGFAARELVILSASSVIVAACEELLFRGVLFKGLYEWLGRHAALLDPGARTPGVVAVAGAAGAAQRRARLLSLGNAPRVD